MANTYLKRSLGTATSNKKGTWSFWVKKSKIGDGMLVGNEVSNSNNRGYIQFNSSDKLRIMDNDDGGDNCQMITTQAFKDTNAWYHFVFAFDTTQSTASDRIKWYVNGEQITAFDTASYPAQDIDLKIFEGGQTNKYHIGSLNNSGSGSNFFDGCMSHVHFSDGQQLAPTVFGETDATTGEWTIKTSPSFTLGNNGFTILKDGNTITDQSSNSNDFTLGGGTLTKTEDCPDNVFASGNPLSAGTNLAFSNGNNQIRNDTSTFNSALGTLAFGTGKYYFEAYRHGGGGTANVGITLSSKFGGNHSGVDSGRIMYSSNGNIYKEAWSGLSNVSVATVTDTDIVGVSIDTENGILKFYRNGVLVDTTTNSLLLSSNNEFIPAFAFHNGGELRLNFGNGYFGSTQISSAGTNASGNGIFEYDVQPTDATALSTKGLNL